jgi:hypothetical protein
MWESEYELDDEELHGQTLKQACEEMVENGILSQEDFDRMAWEEVA